jgi:copper chaperone
MIVFQVNDMTCGHCVGTITKAVAAADQGATVRIDLPSHRVEIEPAAANEAQLGAAIEAAGFTPEPARASSGPWATAAAPKRGGCCCS